MEKAYKLLALQENISNNEAKNLIDAGVVSAKGAKIGLARALMSEDTKFKITQIQKAIKIFEDDDIIAINKPTFVTSEKLANEFGYDLLNRLDKETSGVVLLYKNTEFREKAIREFRRENVEKTYFAVVQGIVAESSRIDLPISTFKTPRGALSKIDLTHGKNAVTNVFPFLVSGKKSLVKITIETGRTHQIRCHLANAKMGVVGDEKYAKNIAKRMYLHSYEIKLLGYDFIAKLDKSFCDLGFDIPRELL